MNCLGSKPSVDRAVPRGVTLQRLTPASQPFARGWASAAGVLHSPLVAGPYPVFGRGSDAVPAIQLRPCLFPHSFADRDFLFPGYVESRGAVAVHELKSLPPAGFRVGRNGNHTALGKNQYLSGAATAAPTDNKAKRGSQSRSQSPCCRHFLSLLIQCRSGNHYSTDGGIRDRTTTLSRGKRHFSSPRNGRIAFAFSTGRLYCIERSAHDP